METTQAPITGWTDKQKVMQTYDGILFGLRKKQILTLAVTQLNLEDVLLGEMSQSQKHSSYRIFTYRKNPE